MKRNLAQWFFYLLSLPHGRERNETGRPAPDHRHRQAKQAETDYNAIPVEWRRLFKR